MKTIIIIFFVACTALLGVMQEVCQYLFNPANALIFALIYWLIYALVIVAAYLAGRLLDRAIPNETER